jgi:hypothetical protein
MASAFGAAEAVSTALNRPAEARQALSQFENQVSSALDRFSWFIYRMNRPAIRDLFMNPKNYLRMQEAILSLLSGEVFGPSPIHFRLTLFKGLYYIKSGIDYVMKMTTARPSISKPSAAVSVNP